ncbi:MAG TPA: c-type cytochrome [Thermoleophilaceae bacterium]|jgi:cytochrome c553
MTWLLVVGPFLVLGIVVLFVAFSGGAGAAREAYLTRGGRAFAITVAVLYVVLGIAVPAVVIASRGETEGGVGALRTEALSKQDELGKTLFIETCKSCHNLDAVQAKGVTGPDLDELGGLDKQRVLNAIHTGGTGQNRMPKDLLTGSDAQAVADYVSKVAGQ